MKYFDIVRKPTHQTPLPPWAVPRRLQPECGSRARELLNKPSHYHLTPFVAGCSVVPWQGADTVCIAYIISCISSSGICWVQNGICSVKTDIGILHRRFDDLLEGVFGSLWNKILGKGQQYIYIYEIWWNLKIKQLQMIKIDETIYHNKDHVKTMPKGKQVMNKMKMDEHKKWKTKTQWWKLMRQRTEEKTDEHQSWKWKK